MKKFISLLMACILSFGVVSFPALAEGENAENTGKLPWDESQVIDIIGMLEGKDALHWVIIGDSISAPSANGANANWATMLEHRIKNELGRKHDVFVNVGIAGYNYNSFLSNWEGRVAKYKPDIALIFLGMNGGKNETDVRNMYKKLKETNPDMLIIPIITSPQKYTSYENPEYGSSKTWEKAVMTLEIAKEFGLNTVNLMQGFLDRRCEVEAIYGNELVDPSNEKTDAKFETMYFRSKTTLMAHNGQPDDVHPDNAGHPLIAKLVFKQLGLWDLEDSSVCRYIENEKYDWGSRKSPYVVIDKSAIEQKQFPKAYARFMGAYSNGTSFHKSFPALALVGGDTFSGFSEYTGIRNVSQQIAYVIGLRSNMESKYNNSRVVNAGFGDATIVEMTDLFEKNIASVGATLVLFMPDFNELEALQNTDMATYKACLEKVIALTKENKSELGFITPPAKGDYTDQYIDAFVATLLQTAAENSVPVIDFNQVMKDTAKSYPNIYKDWYDENGDPNVAMNGALTDCIMDSIGYVNDAGVLNYFASNIYSQHTYRQNKITVASQNFADGKWTVKFDISALNAEGELLGVLNDEEIALERNGNYITVEMPYLTNTFYINYVSEGKKYYTPTFKQYVEAVYLTENGANVSIATGNGRCTVAIDKANVTITEPLHETAGHPYTVINVRANANDEGYTVAKREDIAPASAEVSACSVDQEETVYSDAIWNNAKSGMLGVYDKDGKLVYVKSIKSETEAVHARKEIYGIFGPTADVRATVFTK